MKLNNLKPGEVHFIVPPKVECLLSGLYYITVSKKLLITLHYVDKTQESRRATNAEFESLSNKTFDIVSFVQSSPTTTNKEQIDRESMETT
jgi:hypothetical protein